LKNKNFPVFIPKKKGGQIWKAEFILGAKISPKCGKEKGKKKFLCFLRKITKFRERN
jgi:hypothetical protein